VQQRVEFKVATLVHQALSGHAPSYTWHRTAALLPTLVQEDCARLTLERFSSVRTNFGDKAFDADELRVWNDLPPDLRQHVISKRSVNPCLTALYKSSYILYLGER